MKNKLYLFLLIFIIGLLTLTKVYAYCDYNLTVNFLNITEEKQKFNVSLIDDTIGLNLKNIDKKCNDFTLYLDVSSDKNFETIFCGFTENLPYRNNCIMTLKDILNLGADCRNRYRDDPETIDKYFRIRIEDHYQNYCWSANFSVIGREIYKELERDSNKEKYNPIWLTLSILSAIISFIFIRLIPKKYKKTRWVIILIGFLLTIIALLITFFYK